MPRLDRCIRPCRTVLRRRAAGPAVAASVAAAIAPASSLADDAPTPAPLGQVTPVVDAGPTEAVMIAYEGPGSWKLILDRIAAVVTTDGDADVVVVVDDALESDEAMNFITAAGADMDRVSVFIQETDSIWIRDYGPRPAIEAGIRIFSDATYNRPRPADDALAAAWTAATGRLRYALPLVMGGGNLVAFPGGEGRATGALITENPDLTPDAIAGDLSKFLGVNTTISPALPPFIDPTFHIDTWLMPVDNAVVISDWTADPGSPQDALCDSVAAELIAGGRTVVRLPARFVNDVHYSYTNALICNDVILIPTYAASVMADANIEALTAWASVAGGRTVVPVEIDPLAQSGGGLHTVSLNLPAWIGGPAPRVRVQTPEPGTALTPGETVDITWISDDDVGTSSVDIFASIDGGQTFNFLITINSPDDGHAAWTVPSVFSPDARIQVRVRDVDGLVGIDATDGPLIIGTPPLVGDLNGDGEVNFSDLVLLLGTWGPCGNCSICPADFDGNCLVDFIDLIELLTQLS